METLEQLKEIVKNAPDGATCIEIPAIGLVCDYFKVEDYDFYFWWDPDLQDWVEYDKDDLVEIRSLSDIKQIIELMEGQKKVYQAYVSLEEVKQKYNGQNKIAKALLKLAYECDEFALPSDLRKDIKEFLGGL